MNVNGIANPCSEMGLGDVRVKEEPSVDFQFSDSAQVGNSKPPPKDDTTSKSEKNLSRDEEDLVIYSLYQLWNKMRVCWKLLNSHLAGKSENELKQRYETTVSKKLELRQIQNLVFGINMGEKSFVVVISGREVLVLKCNVKEVNGKKSYCVHPGLKQFIVEDISEPGVLLKMLTSFLHQNLPTQFLQRDPTYIDFIVNRLNDDLKFPGGVSSMPQNLLLNVKEEVESENALYYDNNGQFLLDEDQEKVLENIIGEIGKHWASVFKALIDMFGKPHPESPYGATFSDSALFGKLEDYYLENLVPILGQFTPDEDAQILALSSVWGKQWASIARHLHGRTQTQVQARFTNVLASEASARKDDTSVFALKIFSKPISSRKLEVNKLVVATRGSIYLLSCTPASIPCSHAQLQEQTFNHDPQKSSQQFLTFIKLTVANQLAGIDEDDLKYVGDGIHEIVEKAEKSRNVIRDDNLVQEAARHYASMCSVETRIDIRYASSS